MKINLNQSSNFFFLHSSGPLCSPHKIMPIFQDCPNPGAGGRRWDAASGCATYWSWEVAAAQRLLGAASWRQCLLSIHPLTQWRSTVLHIVLVAGDTAGRKGLTSYLSTWGSQSRGEGDRQSPSPFGTLGGLGRHHHLGLWEGWGDKPRQGREKKELEEWGKRLIQEAAQMS